MLALLGILCGWWSFAWAQDDAVPVFFDHPVPVTAISADSTRQTRYDMDLTYENAAILWNHALRLKNSGTGYSLSALVTEQRERRNWLPEGGDRPRLLTSLNAAFGAMRIWRTFQTGPLFEWSQDRQENSSRDQNAIYLRAVVPGQATVSGDLGWQHLRRRVRDREVITDAPGFRLLARTDDTLSATDRPVLSEVAEGTVSSQLPTYRTRTALTYRSTGADLISLGALQDLRLQRYLYPALFGARSGLLQEEDYGWAGQGAWVTRRLETDLRLSCDAAYRKVDYIPYATSAEDSLASVGNIEQNDRWERQADWGLSGKRTLVGPLALEMGYTWHWDRDRYRNTSRNLTQENAEASAALSLTGRDVTVRLEGAAGRLAVDDDMGTASLARDVLTRRTTLSAQWPVTTYVTLNFSGSYRENQHIYLRSAQSGSNYHNRNYALNPQLVLTLPGGFTLLQGGNISANYFVYDHTAEQNSILRQAFYTPQLELPLTRHLTLKGLGLLRFEDYGKLVYRNQWVEQLAWDRVTSGIGFSLLYAPAPRFTLEPGGYYEDRTQRAVGTDPVTTAPALQVQEQRWRGVWSLTGTYRAGTWATLAVEWSFTEDRFSTGVRKGYNRGSAVIRLQPDFFGGLQ